MKKITILLTTIAVLAACAPKDKTAEQLTLEISKTRAQISDLNVKLTELENQLATFDQVEINSGIKVKVEGINTSTFESYINTSAIIEAVNLAMISPEVNGKIMKIHVEEGNRVTKGQLLVTLDSEIMTRSLSEMDKALELTKTLFDKQKDLYDQGVGSEMQYLEIKNRYESMLKSKETLETQMKMSKIYAPFAGIVESVFLKEGELATPGRQIIELVNLQDLYINTELSENYLSAVHTGDTTWVSFPNLPELKQVARIAQTGKVINPNSRTFSVRVDMKNTKEVLKPNMMATLTIRDYYNPEAILVPTIMIRQDPNGSFVYLARQHDGDSFATKTYIETGRSDGTSTEVTKGLEPGDLLITDGYNLVKDGNTIEIVY